MIHIKKIRGLVYLIVIGSTLIACGGKKVNNAGSTASSSDGNSKSMFNEKEKEESDILENGYPVGDYLFKLMPMQKEDEAAKRSILSNIDMNVKYNFEEIKEEINDKQKISLLTSYVEFDNKNEKLNVNYFLVNKSDEIIKSITLKGETEFKDIPKQTFIFEFSNEQFGSLKKNEFIHFSASYDIPITYMNELKTMKRKELKIDINTMKVNDVEIDNSSRVEMRIE